MTPTPAPTPSDVPDTIAKNPALVAVLTGQIPGVLAKGTDVYPSAQNLSDSPEDIDSVGLRLFVSQGDGSRVIYNPAAVSEDEIQAADAAGKLADMFPDYGVLTGEQPVQGDPTVPLDDQLAATGAPSPALDPAGPAATTLSAMMPPPPPATITKPLNRERVANLQPGPPTTGPKPGAGRLANMLATSAV